MFKSSLQSRHWSYRLSARLVSQVALLFKALPRCIRADAPQLQQKLSVTAYFDRPFLQPIENPQLKAAVIRAKAH
jgi:hypothetical protein